MRILCRDLWRVHPEVAGRDRLLLGVGTDVTRHGVLGFLVPCGVTTWGEGRLKPSEGREATGEVQRGVVVAVRRLGGDPAMAGEAREVQIVGNLSILAGWFLRGRYRPH